jgi:RND family efflux transporter MFP subunit
MMRSESGNVAPKWEWAVKLGLAMSLAAVVAGCDKKAAAPPPPQAMPVQVKDVTLNPVPQGDTYIATIKSRKSATLQPQVDGTLRRILVKSGDHVGAGQLMMTIDPLKQEATVQQQIGTEEQKRATNTYAKAELDRQKQLFAAGIISKDAFEIAQQNYDTSAGDLASATAQTVTQKQELAYYQIRAPFAGIVGDIPVHVGDYVSPTTMLTTVDGGGGLEAYIYIPAERSAELKLGLPVTLLDDAGQPLVTTSIAFLSPEVDNGLQSILAKAELTGDPASLRPSQQVKARVVWTTSPRPTVPVLAVSRIGGQAFVYIAQRQGDGYIARQVPVTLGDTIGNEYPVLSGLQPGDKVILSGLQFIADHSPVQPMG